MVFRSCQARTFPLNTAVLLACRISSRSELTKTGLLEGKMLVASAVTLHVLSGRIHTAADARRFSWLTFWWDVVVVSFAILTFVYALQRSVWIKPQL